MAFERPSLLDLASRVLSDITARLQVGSAQLRRSFITVISRVFAGGLHEQYGYLDYIYRQALPDTAEDLNLERWANIFNLTKTPSTFASGNVTFTGTNGSIIPSGAQLKRSDGLTFTTQSDATIAGGIATTLVQADISGDASNGPAGATLTLVQTYGGIASNATVAAGGISGGSEVENDDSLRIRLLQRLREPPMGGAAYDYIQWSLAANPAVTRAWVYPLENGAGTVVVRAVTDNAVGGPIPSAGVISDIADYIAARKPVTAAVTVLAPVAVTRNFTIDLTPDTVAVRAAVEAELRDMILRDSEPGGILYFSRMNEAISIAAGESDHVLTVPSANVVYASGQFPVFGTITWI